MNSGTHVLQRLRRATGRRAAQLCCGLAVALIVGGLTGQMGAKSALAYVPCEPGWQYDVVTKYGSVHDVNSGPYFKNWAATNSTMTVVSTVSGSTQVQATISGTISADAIVYGASLTTSISLTGTLSWSAGNTMSFAVPAKRFGNAIYGAWRWKTYGHYYYLSDHCGISNSSYIYTWVPERATGWRTWISLT
jgi:hypothetical protein